MKILKNIAIVVAFLFIAVKWIIRLLKYDTWPRHTVFIFWAVIILVCIITIFMLWHDVFRSKRLPPIDYNQHYLVISHALYRREVEWRHITGFSPYEYEDTDWVLVHVDNVDEILESTNNWFKLFCLELTYEKFGALYAIRAVNLTMTPQQLCEELTAELNKRKARPSL